MSISLSQLLAAKNDEAIALQDKFKKKILYGDSSLNNNKNEESQDTILVTDKSLETPKKQHRRNRSMEPIADKDSSCKF